MVLDPSSRPPAPGGVATFHHREFSVELLVEAKAGRHLSVCLPAHNEEATIRPIVAALVADLVERHTLVDEVLVMDDHSTDATAAAAADAGAVVVAVEEVLPEMGPGSGKGEALWKALHASKGDIIAFCDADVRDFHPRLVTGVLGPLLAHRDIAFTKGFYRRPLDGVAGEGGRVTELVARPLISLFFPELIPIAQPLAGEFAARRSVLEAVPFPRGYGVDVALLIEATRRFGLAAVAQVDLGERVHRNRPLDQLGPQALAVARTILTHAGVELSDERAAWFVRPGHEPVAVDTGERPPITDVEAYRRTR